MLRISKLADYGTLVMSEMARQPERVFSATELALGLGLGLPTVRKVLKALARRDLVTGVRGLRGGYCLTRPADQISVADIVDALEDQPFGLTECSAATGLCYIEGTCGIRAGWRTINRIVRRALEGVSVASMVQPQPAPQRSPTEAVNGLSPVRRSAGPPAPLRHPARPHRPLPPHRPVPTLKAGPK